MSTYKVFLRSEARLGEVARQVASLLDKPFHRSDDVFLAGIPGCNLMISGNEASAPRKDELDLRSYSSVVQFDGSAAEQFSRQAVKQLSATGGFEILFVREHDGKLAAA